RILGAQLERRVQALERLAPPAQAVKQLAERDQGRRIVRQPARERRERGERPRPTSCPRREAGKLERERPQRGSGGRPRRETGRRGRPVAASPGPPRELVQ